MRVIIAFSLLIASITAFPQTSSYKSSLIEGINQNDERIVTGAIVRAIAEVSQAIKDAGLDPVKIEKVDAKYELPVPVLFNTQLEIEDLLFTGLSNIVVHRINFSIISNRLTFDIRLPLIEFTLGKIAQEVTLFGSTTDAYASGRLAIVGIRLEGNIRVRLGAISGISIRSINMDFSLGGIESNMKIVTHGKDFSDVFNKFAGETVPKTIAEYKDEINELIEIIIRRIVDEM